MNQLITRQRGFAMPAFFIAVAIAFVGSLGVKTEDGTTLASKMGFGEEQSTSFAAVEGEVERSESAE